MVLVFVCVIVYGGDIIVDAGCVGDDVGVGRCVVVDCVGVDVRWWCC